MRAITDSTGAVVAHYEYGAWGELLSSSSPFASGFAYLFLGEHGVRYDIAVGLYFTNHRPYSADLARFLSRDQLGLSSAPNPYWYSENNPVNLIDFTGLKSDGWWGGVIEVYQYYKKDGKALSKKIGEIVKGKKSKRICQLEELMTKAAQAPLPDGVRPRGIGIETSKGDAASERFAKQYSPDGKSVTHNSKFGRHHHSKSGLWSGLDPIDPSKPNIRFRAHFKAAGLLMMIVGLMESLSAVAQAAPDQKCEAVCNEGAQWGGSLILGGIIVRTLGPQGAALVGAAGTGYAAGSLYDQHVIQNTNPWIKYGSPASLAVHAFNAVVTAAYTE